MLSSSNSPLAVSAPPASQPSWGSVYRALRHASLFNRTAVVTTLLLHITAARAKAEAVSVSEGVHRDGLARALFDAVRSDGDDASTVQLLLDNGAIVSVRPPTCCTVASTPLTLSVALLLCCVLQWFSLPLDTGRVTQGYTCMHATMEHASALKPSKALALVRAVQSLPNKDAALAFLLTLNAADPPQDAEAMAWSFPTPAFAIATAVRDGVRLPPAFLHFAPYKFLDHPPPHCLWCVSVRACCPVPHHC